VIKFRPSTISFFILLAVIILLESSCASTRIKEQIPEDELFITRRYIGNFIDYWHVPPGRFGNPHLVWIKTSIDTTATSLSVYTNECSFERGDRLYLRRSFTCPGIWGSWEYQLENDNNVFYKISEFQYENKVLLQAWF
jgi:hypothetical protein